MTLRTIDSRSLAASRLPVRFQHPSKSVDVALTVVDAELVDAIPVPLSKRARPSGYSERPNISTLLDAQRIQNALRSAERGETRDLFTIYRDELLGYSHLQSEWLKRKAVIVGQPHALIPKDKKNADDVQAAEVIGQMIENCNGWTDGLTHLLDASLYPVSVSEKIFSPVGMSDTDALKHPVRYLLKEISAIPYDLLCFRLPYQPTIEQSKTSILRTSAGYDSNPAMIYNVDDWESGLRFYETMPNGSVNYSMTAVYAPDKERHIVHRGNMLSRSIRDNFGGVMRASLFWYLLATKGRDWFAVYMQKYGSPFLVGKADVQDKNTVDFLTSAFAMSTQIGGIIIDKRSELDLREASAQDGSNAHKNLQTVCNDEISKLIVGQVLSSSAKNTGLGSGVANLHGEVRQDIRLYDMCRLSETLEKQLFTPYLTMNGYRGRAPSIRWGGEKEHEALALAQSVNQFKQGGLEPTDEGLQVISHRIGYDLQRAPEPVLAQPKPSPAAA